MLAVTAWDAALILSKIGVVLGLLAAAGCAGALQAVHDGTRAGHLRLLGYGLAGAVLGFHGSLFLVLVQLGQINDAGLMGMFDLDLALLLRGTPVWESAAFRGVGFGLSALVTLASIRALKAQRSAPPKAFYRIAQLGQLLALGLVLVGFTLLGHVSVLSWLLRCALAVHVGAVACWIGMLLPLRWSCERSGIERLSSQMRAFGRAGVVLVLALGLSGTLLLLTLSSPSELLTTAYGRLLSLKLLLFLALVTLAALNKLRFVPQMSRGDVLPLRRSIGWEIVVAALVLLLTAVLSTVLGPSAH